MKQHSEHFSGNAGQPAIDQRVLEEISRALGSLRFGSLEITVHDGRVTQIESKKKIRLS